MVNKNQVVIATAVGLTVLAVAFVVLLSFTISMSGTGTIASVGCKVYADEALTQEISAVDWGTLSPGGHSDVTFWVKSTSTVPTTLSLSTNTWNPAHAENHMSLTWTYNGNIIQPGAVEVVDLTLNADSGIVNVTDFSFNIVLTMTQVE